MPPPPRTARTVGPLTVAPLLFGSGACALIYQVAWLRMLRLVFGGTTAASAAVLAIFMGGLGFGALALGRRADRTDRPLRLYATLELGVAVAAAASPLLVMLVRAVYIALGGVQTLGMPAATGLRLALSALVLGIPTFLMGGTLPAAVRAMEDASDPSRRVTGGLYGANAIGAVLGTLSATFVWLEMLGTNTTLWGASAVNGLVALLAFAVARRQTPEPAPQQPAQRVFPDETAMRTGAAATLPGAAPPPTPPVPVTFILLAASVVGFAFLLMELVWYRMLAPLLGGSTYTFGLILAIALLGIGIGGLLYAAGRAPRQPTLLAFANTCGLEALCIVLPYAAGDRVALLTLMVQPPDAAAFVRVVLGWVLVTTVVVLPAAVVAGYQFPLLVALLGKGERHVGRDVGSAYACNTLGAIGGSLAGGFGLLPLLSATGTWAAVVGLLSSLALASTWQGRRQSRGVFRRALPVATAGLAGLLCTAPGPTAFWRQSPIGARRVAINLQHPNDVTRALHEVRRGTIWQRDGVESSVGLSRISAYSLIVNGKSDGNAIDDAPTMVMSGLIGAILHPNLKRVLVIGLGTGSTAGWLAQIPSVQRVNVVELEPAIEHVADVCSPVNREALANPKVHVIVGDGREQLLTSRDTYDLICSEPSNPYRAGVASLFTQEFYRAVAARLNPDGVFVQWIQAYEITRQSLQGIYATLRTALPAIESWEAGFDVDLLLIATRRPRPHDLAVLRARVEQEPYRSALALLWGVSGVEGLYAGFVGTAGLAGEIGDDAGARVNTDDQTVLEYELARSVGSRVPRAIGPLRERAAASGVQYPLVTGGTIDWQRVEELRGVRALAERSPARAPCQDAACAARALARQAYAGGNLAEARRHWQAQGEAPVAPADTAMVAEILADAADPQARPYIETVRLFQPAEAEALLALWQYRAGAAGQAAAHLAAAFQTYRRVAWARSASMQRALMLAETIASQHLELARLLVDVLAEPFAVRALDDDRLRTRASISLIPGLEDRCADALAALEPDVPWDREFLRERLRCYTRAGHPLEHRARADLQAFGS